MATIIYFTKEERLAMLKIMIEINNHYCNRGLPKAFEFIQDTANYFNLFTNDISAAYLLDSKDVQNILEGSFRKSLDKENFFRQLICYMLIIGQNVDFRNGRKRWGYINMLVDGCLSSKFSFTYADNPIKGIGWYLILDEQHNQNTISQSNERANSPIIFQSNPSAKNKQSSNDRISKYSDAVKEKLAILRILFELNNRFALSKGTEFIQDTANYLGVSRIKRKAHLMTLADAKNILEKVVGNDFDKEWFIRDLFNYFLIHKDLGASAQKKQFKDAVALIGKKIYSSYSQSTSNPLTSPYFHLTKGGNSDSFTIEYVYDTQDEDDSPIPSKNTIETRAHKDLYSTPILEKKQVSDNSAYSNVINEVLYKDL